MGGGKKKLKKSKESSREEINQNKSEKASWGLAKILEPARRRDVLVVGDDPGVKIDVSTQET